MSAPARPGLLLLAPLLALALSGCGGGGPASAVPPRNTWTWIDLPQTACGDGTPTGFGVNPGEGDEVVLFLDGGGACWSYDTCFAAFPTATPGPFGKEQFAVRSVFFGGTLLDRGLPPNPLARATYVYVPYCTGDLHAGEAVQAYAAPGGATSRTYLHHGRANVRAVLERAAALFPSPSRVLVAGASAGGFGALLAYDAARARWPAATGFLLDDSGPPLPGDAVGPPLRQAWRASWALDPLLDEVCPACRDDFSAIVPALSARHPQDRFALLSSLQDGTIRSYLSLSAADFELALRALLAARFDPLANAHAFVVAGSDHALSRVPGAYEAGGVPLTTWLAQMLSGDPAWRSAGP